MTSMKGKIASSITYTRLVSYYLLVVNWKRTDFLLNYEKSKYGWFEQILREKLYNLRIQILFSY